MRIRQLAFSFYRPPLTINSSAALVLRTFCLLFFPYRHLTQSRKLFRHTWARTVTYPITLCHAATAHSSGGLIKINISVLGWGCEAWIHPQTLLSKLLRQNNWLGESPWGRKWHIRVQRGVSVRLLHWCCSNWGLSLESSFFYLLKDVSVWRLTWHARWNISQNLQTYFTYPLGKESIENIEKGRGIVIGWSLSPSCSKQTDQTFLLPAEPDKDPVANYDVPQHSS